MCPIFRNEGAQVAGPNNCVHDRVRYKEGDNTVEKKAKDEKQKRYDSGQFVALSWGAAKMSTLRSRGKGK